MIRLKSNVPVSGQSPKTPNKLKYLDPILYDSVTTYLGEGFVLGGEFQITVSAYFVIRNVWFN